MVSPTLGGVLAALAPVAVAVVSTVAQTLVNRWLDRTGKRDGPPLRRRVIDGWGWVTITAVVLAAAVVAALLGTVVAWILGSVVAVGYIIVVAWWGWRRMPLLTPEARDWLDSWLAANGSWGGLSYRLEPVGLAERTYTVQDLSRVDAPGNRPSRDGSREILTPDDLLARGVNVLVTGEGGVGKTTNLRHIGKAARRFWVDVTRRASSVEAPSPGWLPVLLAARDLVDKASVEEALGAPSGMLSRAPAPGAQWLVLVDAVDEVLNASQRQHVWELLLEAVREGGPRRFVITSRSVDSTRWRDLQYRDVAHYQLHPFTDDQLLTFVVRHQSRRVKSSGAEQAEAKKRATRFVEQVRRQGLIEVVRLPLLAKLAADMYFDNQSRELPMRRVDLYEHSIEQWLDKFDEALENQVLRGVSARERNDVHNLLDRLDRQYAKAASGGRVKVLRAFLTDLAVTHNDDNRTDIDPDLVDTAATQMGISRAAGIPVTRLAVGRVLEATGLIRDPYHDARFWHQTFSEYLAAPQKQFGFSDDAGHWGQLFDDPATRPGAVFAFHHLAEERQQRVITALTATPRHLHHAAILAAEGICSNAVVDEIVDSLWQSKPELKSESIEQRVEYQAWWDGVSDLSGHPVMNLRLNELCDNRHSPFHDRVNATAVLARQGDDLRRGQLDQLVRAAESRKRADYSSRRERSLVAEALARIDDQRGADMLWDFVNGVGFDVSTQVHLAAALARVDRDRGVKALATLAYNQSLSRVDRSNVQKALARFRDAPWRQ